MPRRGHIRQSYPISGESTVHKNNPPPNKPNKPNKPNNHNPIIIPNNHT